MATSSSFHSNSFDKVKQQKQKVCSPDILNKVLQHVFPALATKTLGFHNLDAHVNKILGNEVKAATSTKSPRPGYLKGFFGEKKTSKESKEAEKPSDADQVDGRLGSKMVRLQAHTFDTVSSDSLGIIGNSNFQSVKANCCVYKGKWMYEVLLGSSGLMQIGWCTSSCKFTREEGVGDTPDSYAYDGYRETKWNARGSAKYGETWNQNDVVTCLLDLDNATVSFTLNGKDLGIAFKDIPVGPGIAYFPAFSIAYKEILYVNFGQHLMKYTVPGYNPVQSPSENFGNAKILTKSLESLMFVRRSIQFTEVDEITENEIAAQIFQRLGPLLTNTYTVEATLLQFMYKIRDEGTLHRLLEYMWSFMESYEMEECLCLLMTAVIRQYKTSPLSRNFAAQKTHLKFILWIVRHNKTKSYVLKGSKMTDIKKIEFPYLFHIVQPGKQAFSDLDKLFPGLECDLSAHQGNYKNSFMQGSKELKEKMTSVEDLQRDIIRCLIVSKNEQGRDSNQNFVTPFREYLKQLVTQTREHNPLCSSIVLHSFLQRLIDIVKELWDNTAVTKANYVASAEGYIPLEMFYSGMLDYFDLQRAGGLVSHLLQEHKERLEKEGVHVKLGSAGSRSDSWRDDHRVFLNLLDSEAGPSLSSLVTSDESDVMESFNPVMRLARALLQQGSKPSSADAPSASRKRAYGQDDNDEPFLPTQVNLLELTDGCIMLYTQIVHQQMDKICSVRSKFQEFSNSLSDILVKLEKCDGPEHAEVKKSLLQSKELLWKHVTAQCKTMSWFAASTYAPESQHNLWWIFQICLRTLEKASNRGVLFAFVPEFYITGMTRLYKCLREYFAPTQLFESLPNLHNVLLNFSLVLSQLHNDPRIISTDVKTVLATTLASFVTYADQVKAIETMPQKDQHNLLVKILQAYDEDKPWTSMGHRILAAMWKGSGFGMKYSHPPYLTKVKKALNREKDPYVSSLLQSLIYDIIINDHKLSSEFVHSIINHLNWCFSELINQMQEVQQQSQKAAAMAGTGLLSALDAQALRQVRIVDMLYEISVSLLQVLEMTTSIAPEIYVDWEGRESAEVLLTSLTQVVNQILNRITTKQNIFDKIVKSNHPGLRVVGHYSIVATISGILIALLTKTIQNEAWHSRTFKCITKDSGFDLRAIKFILEGEKAFAKDSDLPSTSLGASSSSTAQFSLRHHVEVSPAELQEVEELTQSLEEYMKHAVADEPMDEDNMCTICYANNIQVMFNPCHHTSCRSCITQQMMISKECFFCKATVKDFSTISDNALPKA